MNTKSTLLLTSVLLSVLACSNDKGSGSSSSAPKAEATNVSEVPAFQKTNLMPAIGEDGYKEYVETRYGKTCQVYRSDKGEIESYRDKEGFDANLKVGDESFTKTQTTNLFEDRKFEERYTVSEKSLQKVSLKITYFSLFFSAAGGELLTKPAPDQGVCVFVGEHMDCDFSNKTPDEMSDYLTPQGLQYMKTRKDSEVEMEMCRIQNADSFDSKTELGQYKLQDGQSIEAYMTTEIAKGKVLCGDKDMGAGEVKSYKVNSFAIKAIPGIGHLTGEMQCGGVLLVDSHVVSVGGKAVSSYRFEQVKPALK